MTELETVEEGNEVGRKSGRKLGRKGRRKCRHYRAALKLRSPVLPIVAVVVAALTYIVLGKPPDGTIEVVRWSINQGIFASLASLLVSLAVRAVIAVFARKRATAEESDLIIRRLEQQTEKYKADLESTQSAQSTESRVKTEVSTTTAQLA